MQNFSYNSTQGNNSSHSLHSRMSSHCQIHSTLGTWPQQHTAVAQDHPAMLPKHTAVMQQPAAVAQQHTAVIQQHTAVLVMAVEAPPVIPQQPAKVQSHHTAHTHTPVHSKITTVAHCRALHTTMAVDLEESHRRSSYNKTMQRVPHLQPHPRAGCCSTTLLCRR